MLTTPVQEFSGTPMAAASFWTETCAWCTKLARGLRELRDDADTLLECVMRCRVLGDAIDDGDVDEVRERVVGKATLEVVDLRFGFVAECV